MKSIKLLATLLSATLLLTACSKEEAEVEVPEPVSTGVTNPTQTQLDALNGSPTISIWTAGMKLGTTLMLLEKHPNMSEKDQECLMGKDADPAYFENSKREMLAVLGEDGIKTADEFYNSEVGKKVALFSQEQMAIAAGKKVTNPTTLTDEEQAKMQAFMESDMMTKMRNNIATISPEKMEADLAIIAEQEAVRCNLTASDSQAKPAEQTNTTADFAKKATPSSNEQPTEQKTDEKK